MKKRYDVERMLNRLVETNEPDDNDLSAVYSWQKDVNYRDRKTENLSVDDLINSIGSPGSVKGKHEADSIKVRPVKSSEKDKHVVKQKIVYRTPIEVQQQADKTEDIDSKTYLNNMLDRMEKELNIQENPLKPKVVRSKNQVSENNSYTGKHQSVDEEKSPIKLKSRKKYPDGIIENKDLDIDSTEQEPDVLENLNETEDIVEDITINDYDSDNTLENIEKTVIIEDIIEDEEHLLDDFSEESMKNISDEMSILTNETENTEEGEYLDENINQKKRKGFFSRLFSKKEKKNKFSEPEEELVDFDEEEFNKKFDELSEQIENLTDDNIVPEDFEIPEINEISEDTDYQDYSKPEEEQQDIQQNILEESEEIYQESQDIPSDFDETFEEISDDSATENDDNLNVSDTEDDAESDDNFEDETIDSNDDEDLFIDNKLSDDNDDDSDQKPKNKKYTYFGFIVAILAIIGLISLIFVGVRALYLTVFSSSIKTEATSLVYPLVAEDITPFNSIEECSDSDIIGASILNILMNEDTSVYGDDSSESLIIPQVDVELSAKELFGNDAKISVHSNVTVDSTTFYYDENGSDYIVPAKPLIYTTKPSIEKIVNSGNTYTAQVLYLNDYPDWIENKDAQNYYYSKICYYTLEKDENGKLYITSVLTETN